MTVPQENGENNKWKGPSIFGRRLFTVPCFKEALKTSTLSGMGLGLASFWFTSDVPKSMQRTFLVMLVVHPISWFYCRYNFRKEIARIQEEKLKHPSQKPSFLLAEDKDNR